MYFITNGPLATATSMLVMDVGDGMFWRQVRDDGFDCFPKFQHSDATNIYVAIATIEVTCYFLESSN